MSRQEAMLYSSDLENGVIYVQITKRLEGAGADDRRSQ